MGAGHGHRLHYHGHSVVHRAPAHLKLAALVGFVLVVVATPREWYAVYAAYLLVVVSVVLLARVPLLYIGRRMVVEVPFLVFALLIPFVATGPRTDVLGPERLGARVCWRPGGSSPRAPSGSCRR